MENEILKKQLDEATNALSYQIKRTIELESFLKELMHDLQPERFKVDYNGYAVLQSKVQQIKRLLL